MAVQTRNRPRRVQEVLHGRVAWRNPQAVFFRQAKAAADVIPFD